MPALIVGASGGIGDAIRSKLASHGIEIYAPTSKELNLADASSVSKWFELHSDKEFSILIYAAGRNNPKEFEVISEGDFEEAMSVNFIAFRNILQYLLPSMRKRESGKILVISSLYSQISRSGRSSYSIAKSALEALVRSVAVEYGSQGIIANSIAPGFIDTQLTRKNNDSVSIGKLLERVPLNRLGTPKEVADFAYFLIGPENSYITGQTLRIDGGYSVN